MKDEPAFPVLQSTGINADTLSVSGGLTKLEWFAGMALKGMLCNGFMPAQAVKAGAANKYDYVMAAFFIAEAMLAESERRSKK